MTVFGKQVVADVGDDEGVGVLVFQETATYAVRVGKLESFRVGDVQLVGSAESEGPLGAYVQSGGEFVLHAHAYGEVGGKDILGRLRREGEPHACKDVGREPMAVLVAFSCAVGEEVVFALKSQLVDVAPEGDGLVGGKLVLRVCRAARDDASRKVCFHNHSRIDVVPREDSYG